LFFKKMTENEIVNSKKGQLLGFFTFAIMLFVNIIYHEISEIELFSYLTILLAGLVVAFGYEIILNMMDRSRKIR
jgi:ABC-type bacteriocin/lantibiotic exporter with double-glycine peptidase domain